MSVLPSTESAQTPGLGTLSSLPPEIREQIWKLRFQDTSVRLSTDKDAQHRSFTGYPLHPRTLVKKTKENLQGMAILRTSRQLYGEVSEVFYRHWILTVCIDGTRIRLPKQNKLHIHLDGLCVSRDFTFTNFSRFKTIALDVELSGYIPGDPWRVNDIKGNVDHFGPLLESWQERDPEYRIDCPAIDITLALDDVSPRLIHVVGPVSFYRRLAADFKGLECIQGIKDVRFHGLPTQDTVIMSIFHQAVDEIKNPATWIRPKFDRTYVRKLPKEALLIISGILVELPEVLELVVPTVFANNSAVLFAAYLCLCGAVTMIFTEHRSR
ncbi:MAG: hypothetical protein Q9169_007717 [Polycauliona sp. 2 TL-2023]